MKKIITLLTLTLVCSMATSLPINAKVKFGTVLSTTSGPQPILLTLPFKNFEECLVLGYGALVNERVQVELENLSCVDSEFAYEFDFKPYKVLDISKQSGITT